MIWPLCNAIRDHDMPNLVINGPLGFSGHPAAKHVRQWGANLPRIYPITIELITTTYSSRRRDAIMAKLNIP